MVDAYQLKICSEKTGYEVKPKVRVKIDLMVMKDKILKLTQMRLRIGIPALLLLEGNDGEVINIFPSGRLLLRNFTTQEEAERIVSLLAPLLYS